MENRAPYPLRWVNLACRALYNILPFRAVFNNSSPSNLVLKTGWSVSGLFHSLVSPRTFRVSLQNRMTTETALFGACSRPVLAAHVLSQF